MSKIGKPISTIISPEMTPTKEQITEEEKGFLFGLGAKPETVKKEYDSDGDGVPEITSNFVGYDNHSYVLEPGTRDTSKTIIQVNHSESCFEIFEDRNGDNIIDKHSKTTNHGDGTFTKEENIDWDKDGVVDIRTLMLGQEVDAFLGQRDKISFHDDDHDGSYDVAKLYKGKNLIAENQIDIPVEENPTERDFFGRRKK